ncbi:norbelladine synthase-like [Impatiens glandulifera]|uniref:norbelladine synthase-like n=1 Tax=Impatiens glandulifera TaxID=253017 RepID=UPI001FB0664E|nr:norbelladine synthase-like [Impatiens glandulifera]
MMGRVQEEIEVNVGADQAWKLYGSLELPNLLKEKLKNIILTLNIQGDGGVGTIIELVLQPGIMGFSSYKEKYTKVDDENRVKETEVVEGGYLDSGFNLYRVRLEVIEKSKSSCITRATIEYDLKEEFAANASAVNIQPLVLVMQAAADHLLAQNP